MESEIDKWITGRVKGVSCPKCNNNQTVVPLCFGRPSPDLQKAAQEGKVVLGGCSPGN
jgi:ribosomal protein S27E